MRTLSTVVPSSLSTFRLTSPAWGATPDSLEPGASVRGIHSGKPSAVGWVEAITTFVGSGHSPAMIPATCVPWPCMSTRGPVEGCCDSEKSLCSDETASPVRLPFLAKCGWLASIPESRTPQTIPEPPEP
ncbi:Uncharacterised protein [Mycobacteroides abscessus subsp. abscessus]|nr:Uncharacterised protein [Mycobacteroides abscessus subsp. abscessus]